MANPIGKRSIWFLLSMPLCFHSETKKVILNVCSAISLKSYWKEKELRAKWGSKLCDSTFFLFNQDILSCFTISILGKKKKCSWKPRWKETVLRRKAISDMWIILHYFIASILWLITVSIQNGTFLQCYNLKKIVSFKLLKIRHDYIRYSSVGKESTCRAGDPSSIPRSGKSPGEGNGNPF